MPTATTSPTAVVTSGSTLWGPTYPPTMLWQLVICDRMTDTPIADISAISYGKRWKRRLSRPSEFDCSVPSDHALINTPWTDGRPVLAPGRRTLKLYHRLTAASAWVLVFHGVAWMLEDVGTTERADTSIVAFDPLVMLRFRLARDATGNATFPTFPFPMSGPNFLRALIRNSISNSGPAFDSEGQMGLDVESGIFDAAAPDVTVKLADWPSTIANILTLVTSSGGCDVIVEPVDTTLGFTAGTIGSMVAVERAGYADSIVHYDYGVGDYSIAAIRRSVDMDTVANKLRYLLGPKLVNTQGHWRGSVEATNAGMPDPPQTAINTAQTTSRTDFFQMQDWRIFDDNGDENDVRNLFMRLWQAEATFRAEPREMVFITPIADSPFPPSSSISLGDEIGVNVSRTLRQEFAARQRIYGFDTTISDNGVESVEDLVVSPDGLG